MFHRIVVALNESQEADRALAAAIHLAKTLNAELHAVTVAAGLPAYTAFAEAADSSLSMVLREDRAKSYEALAGRVDSLARGNGVEIHNHLLAGDEVDTIADFLRAQKADLLVVGLHQRDFYIARLWSTVYALALESPCSVLGVH
jgi:nucleotide-binding universal stress UspA family protein